MIVFPPERKVKYEACRNAFCGIKIAMIIIKYFASSCASRLVLYSFGKNGATISMTNATPVQHITENAIILLSVSLAFFIFPAPNSCPTTMATESPKAMNTTLKTLLMVFAIFCAATTFNPRIALGKNCHSGCPESLIKQQRSSFDQNLLC